MVINSGLSRFGFSSFDLIIIWVILYMTKVPMLSGLGDGIMSAPLFISFVVGAYVDKYPKKKFLAILAGMLRAVSLTSIFIGLALNNITIIIASIYIAAFLIGFTSDLLNSVRATWMKLFLDEKSYKNGVSLSNTVYSVAEGIGFIASGLMISLGTSLAFLSILIVFVVSIFPLAFIETEINYNDSKIDVSESLKEGLRFIVKHSAVWEIMVISFIANLVFGMAGIIFVALVQLVYRVSAIYVSIIFAVLVFGIVLGSALGSRVRGKVGIISIESFLVVGAMLISIYFIKNVYIVIVPSIVMGVIIGIVNVVVNVAVLKIIPQDMMARIQGAFSTFSVAVVSVSGLIGGAVIQLIGVLNSFVLMGLIVMVISTLFFIFRDLYSIRV